MVTIASQDSYVNVDDVLTAEVTKLESHVFENTVTAFGPIESSHLYSIHSKTQASTVQQIYVDVGDFVKKGQILIRFDDEFQRQKVANMHAEILRLQALLEEAVENEQRAKALSDKRAVSQQQAQRDATQSKVLRAQLDGAKAQYEMQKIQLSYYTLSAPSDGVIQSKLVNVQDTVSEGLVLLTMFDPTSLRWHARVFANQGLSLSKPVSAEVSQRDGRDISAIFERMSPSIDSVSGMQSVYFSIPFSPTFTVGEVVKGKIKINQRYRASLPVTSLIYRDHLIWVAVLAENCQQVMLKRVSIAAQKEERVEIISGISANDWVVASGGEFLSDGDFIHLPNQQLVADGGCTE